MKLAYYEDKYLAKKYKLDYDVYSAFKKKYSLNAFFRKSKCEYWYDSSSNFSDSYAFVEQIDKDKFIYNFDTGSFSLLDRKNNFKLTVSNDQGTIIRYFKS